MSAERRGVAFTPMEVRREVLVRAAGLADELGYEVFSVAEGWGLDASALLAEIATRTRRITLVAGVLSVWGRSAGTIAMTAATLHQICGGRFVLGLGASTRQLVEGFHGVGYARPVDRLREVTVDVRALLRGERIRHGLRLGQPAVPELPIWLAATGRHSTELAAELADGWLPILLTPDHCRARAEQLRGASPLTVAAGPFTLVDPDPTAARAVAAGCVATYLTAMGEIYPRLVASQGFAAEVELVRSASRGQVPEQAQALLDEFTAYGSAATVRESLHRWDKAADITMVGIPPGLPWPTIEATIRAGAA